MQIPRCGTCAGCKRIEQTKATVLRCANPPFTHATDDVAMIWNQTLYDNPCERWTGEQTLASRAKMMTLDDKIRPVPDKVKVQMVVDVIYTPHGVPLVELFDRLRDVLQNGFSHGGFTGETEAEVDEWSHTIEQFDPAIDCAVSLANILGIESSDLDDLVHDAASSPASAINNQGLDDQVRFLCEQLGASQVIDKLYELRAAEGEQDIG